MAKDSAGSIGDERERTMIDRELNVTVDPAPLRPGEAPVITVAGEIDIQTSPQLEKSLQGILEAGSASVFVDLADVTFLDSTGLSVLVGALQRCREAGGSLRLRSPKPNIRRVLEITGLTEAFQVTSTDSTAG
ncbi:MAG: STAS domain-containing protein [Acidimicrobiales bacterium]